MNFHNEVASLLIDLEAELRRLRYWQAEPPAAAAMQSTEPFAVDTMTLAQWLQFIFLPRVHALAAAEERLPGRCEITPIAEQCFTGTADRELLRLIGSLDALLNSRR